MAKMEPILTDLGFVKRYENNPVLSKEDVPYEATLVFNAGVIKFHGKYYMLFRDDCFNENNKYKYTYLGVADSDDGINWKVRPNTIESDIGDMGGEILRYYDPRLIVIDDEIYMCFAIDTWHGLRGGIGKICGDFESFEVISLSIPDNRNMVLFPEKINGMFVRLERPFPVYSRGVDRFDMWASKSPDLKFWGESELVMAVENVPYANDKIGPGAPPIKTDEGWLILFHTVDIDKTRGKNGWEATWQKRYCIGVALLDLDNPTKVKGMSKIPLMAPDAPYEIADDGYRNNVLFPGAIIPEDDGTVKIYYGASDTVECLATAKLDDLIKACNEAL